MHCRGRSRKVPSGCFLHGRNHSIPWRDSCCRGPSRSPPRESWKNEQGEWQSRTEWHRVVAFDKLGEHVGTLVKSTHVLLQGALRSREYEKDGVKHRVVELRANSIGKLDRPPRTRRPAERKGLSLFGSLVANRAPRSFTLTDGSLKSFTVRRLADSSSSASHPTARDAGWLHDSHREFLRSD